MQEINIAYIGRHERNKDVTYGTGEWAKGQIKSVPSETANKMLKHTDAYRVSKTKEPAESVVPVVQEQADDSNAVQEAFDAIQTMDAEGVRTFAERNFNMKLDGRKSVDKLRTEAQNLIHRFGIPG